MLSYCFNHLSGKISSRLQIPIDKMMVDESGETNNQPLEKGFKMKRFLGKSLSRKGFLGLMIPFYVYNLLSSLLNG